VIFLIQIPSYLSLFDLIQILNATLIHFVLIHFVPLVPFVLNLLVPHVPVLKIGKGMVTNFFDIIQITLYFGDAPFF
jgi:hypothetical protein